MKDPQVAAQKLNSQINLSASKPEKPSITQNSTLYSFKVKWSLANNATVRKKLQKILPKTDLKILCRLYEVFYHQVVKIY